MAAAATRILHLLVPVKTTPKMASAHKKFRFDSFATEFASDSQDNGEDSGIGKLELFALETDWRRICVYVRIRLG